MENIIDRLEKYMNFKTLNNNQITVQAGLSNGLIGKARETRKGLHSDSIEKILNAYSDLNPSWFVIGKGEMLINEINIKENLSSELFNKMLNERDKRIEELSEEKGKLKEQLSVKKYPFGIIPLDQAAEP